MKIACWCHLDRDFLGSGIGRKSSAGEMTAADMVQQAGDALELGASGLAIFHLAAMGDEDFRELGAFKKANG